MVYYRVPFGMMMPDRQWYASNDSSGYRFGFNGQEKDNEVKGVGNSLACTTHDKSTENRGEYSFLPKF